jgi:hypothetical protein
MKEFRVCASLNFSPGQGDGQWHLMFPSKKFDRCQGIFTSIVRKECCFLGKTASGISTYPGTQGMLFQQTGKSAGAKAQIFVALLTARLKSCPDKKHRGGDSRKLAYP